MERIKVKAEVIRAFYDRYENALYVVEVLPQAGEKIKGSFYAKFDSQVIKEMFQKSRGMILEFTVIKRLTRNNKAYYTLESVVNEQEYNDKDLVAKEIQEEKLSLQSTIGNYFKHIKSPSDVILGNILISNDDYRSLEILNDNREIEYEVIAKVSDGYVTTRKVRKKGNKFKIIHIENHYRQCSKDEILAFESDISENVFNTVHVYDLLRIIQEIEFDSMQIEESRIGDVNRVLFDYVGENSLHGMTVSLGSYLVYELRRQLTGKTYSEAVTILNEMDRKTLALGFIKKHRSITHLGVSFEFSYRPHEETLIEDLMKQIDFKIPKHLHKLSMVGILVDSPEFAFKYESIMSVKGLEYKYVENYYRDHLSELRVSYFEEPILKNPVPILNDILIDYGYFLKNENGIDENAALSILEFIFKGIESADIFDLIQQTE